MKRLYLTIMMLAMLVFTLQVHAEGSAIKVEYGSTSMTIELSQKPKILSENGNIVIKTASQTVIVTLPCKVSFQGSSTAIDDVVNIRNIDNNTPIDVFTIDGKKVGTINSKDEMLSLKRGLYIVNGKKIIIK